MPYNVKSDLCLFEKQVGSSGISRPFEFTLKAAKGLKVSRSIFSSSSRIVIYKHLQPVRISLSLPENHILMPGIL